MTLFVQSADGTTPGAVRASLPTRLTRKRSGEWSTPTPETADQFGWFPVTVTAQPAHDPWDSVSRAIVHDGTGFVTQWTVTAGVEPLVDADERVDDDELQASVALLTEDSVGYRAVIGLLLAKGLITEAEVAAAQAAATDRLVTLADNPGVRRQMMADRIARAEQARGR